MKNFALFHFSQSNLDGASKKIRPFSGFVFWVRWLCCLAQSVPEDIQFLESHPARWHGFHL